MKILVLEPYLYDTAPGQRFRIEQWARLLEKRGVAFSFVPFETPALHDIMYRPGHVPQKVREVLRGVARRLRLVRDARAFDAVFVYREAAPLGPPLVERRLAASGVPLIYDFDDAIYLPTASGANRLFASMKYAGKVAKICRLASHVTVGNAYLREFAARHARSTSILPTTIDAERYLPRVPRRADGPVVIGWMGSETTVAHLLTLREPLRDLARRRRFTLRVVSPTPVALPDVDVRWSPWSAEREVVDLQEFDIGIMPLPDDRWARGKCGAKLLQYMGVGVPGVASAVGVNTEIVADDANGLLARHPDEWMDRLSRLIDDAALRARLGDAGRRTVEERYSAQVHAPALLDVFRRCIEERA